MTTDISAPSPVGAVSEPWEVFVERGKIREFAAAMQSDNPAYQGTDAVVPPTFLINAVQWAPPGVRVAVGFERKRFCTASRSTSSTATCRRQETG